MKFLQHPVHPMVVHFPTALLPMDLVLSFLFHTYGNVHFGWAAFYCLVGAVATGLVTLITGLIDLIKIPSANKQAMAGALTHGLLNGTIVVIFAILLYRQWKQADPVADP